MQDDRLGPVVDPFGNTWSMSTHVQDVTVLEMEKGAREAGRPDADQR